MGSCRIYSLDVQNPPSIHCFNFHLNQFNFCLKIFFKMAPQGAKLLSCLEFVAMVSCP